PPAVTIASSTTVPATCAFDASGGNTGATIFTTRGSLTDPPTRTGAMDFAGAGGASGSAILAESPDRAPPKTPPSRPAGTPPATLTSAGSAGASIIPATSFGMTVGATNASTGF